MKRLTTLFLIACCIFVSCPRATAQRTSSQIASYADSISNKLALTAAQKSALTMINEKLTEAIRLLPKDLALPERTRLIAAASEEQENQIRKLLSPAQFEVYISGREEGKKIYEEQNKKNQGK